MEFVSVRIATLRGDQKIPFDLYVSVAGKYIAYVTKGDAIDPVRIDRLKQKNVKKMFIQADAEEAYRQFVTMNIDRAYEKKDAPIEERVSVVQGEQQSNAEAVMESPENADNYALAKMGTSRYVDFLLKEEKAVKAMLDIDNADRSLEHHGVAVSTLAIAIAQKLGITDTARIQMLALGALLHDFGHVKSKLPLFVPITGQTLEVRKEYITHPMAGGEAVRIHRHFDESVIKMIVEHEELIDGSGYPNKLIERNTDPLSVIVSTANEFDRMMLNEKLSRADTLKKFLVDQIGRHPLEHFKILKSII